MSTLRRLEELPIGKTVFTPKALLDADGNDVPVDAPDCDDRAVDVLVMLESGESVIIALAMLDESAGVRAELGEKAS